MNVVDSSGWIEYFVGGPHADFFAEPIEDLGALLVPTICLAEVFRFFLRESSRSSAIEAIALMGRGGIRELDAPLAMLAGQLGVEHALPLADSVVYATARSTSSEVWTQDSDFEGLPGVRFLPRRP